MKDLYALQSAYAESMKYFQDIENTMSVVRGIQEENVKLKDMQNSQLEDCNKLQRAHDRLMDNMLRGGEQPQQQFQAKMAATMIQSIYTLRDFFDFWLNRLADHKK